MFVPPDLFAYSLRRKRGLVDSQGNPIETEEIQTIETNFIERQRAIFTAKQQQIVEALQNRICDNLDNDPETILILTKALETNVSLVSSAQYVYDPD